MSSADQGRALAGHQDGPDFDPPGLRQPIEKPSASAALREIERNDDLSHRHAPGPDDAFGQARIGQRRGPDPDQDAPTRDTVAHPRRADAAHPDHRHAAGPLHDPRHREHPDRQQRRAADPAVPVPQPRGPAPVQQAGEGVDDRDHVRPRVPGHQRHARKSGRPGRVWPREAAGCGPAVTDDPPTQSGSAPNSIRPRWYWDTKVELQPGDPRRSVQTAHHLGVFLHREADHVDQHLARRRLAASQGNSTAGRGRALDSPTPPSSACRPGSPPPSGCTLPCAGARGHGLRDQPPSRSRSMTPELPPEAGRPGG